MESLTLDYLQLEVKWVIIQFHNIRVNCLHCRLQPFKTHNRTTLIMQFSYAGNNIKLAIFISNLSFIIAKLDQPEKDDVSADRWAGAKSSCLRRCRPGAPSRLCYYKFHLELYSTLSGACGLCPKVKTDCFAPQCVTADGFERAILTANRRLPGPSIQVCQGDTIAVDVVNQLPGMSVTIHWHGIRQTLTPWMDGTPMVTQCPILEGQTFRYRFVADEAGTYFWHSHDGSQKVDGLSGSLIVREPKPQDPAGRLYDYDLPAHVMFVQDWMYTMASDRIPGLLQRHLGQSPDTYLINGLGAKLKSMFDLFGPKFTPLAEFRVKKGLRYRFRIISGACLSCPFQLSVDRHRLTVISADGNPVKPVDFDTIVLSSGERYDVILKTDQRPASYWITVRGMGECKGVWQAAVLCYSKSCPQPSLLGFSSLLTGKPGYTLNPRNSKCTERTLSQGVCVSQLRAVLPNPPRLSGTPDLRLFMTFGFRVYNNQQLFRTNSYHRYFVPLTGVQVAGLVNNISNVLPAAPLLTQLSYTPPDMFCEPGTRGGDCVNLIKVALGSVIEIVMVDTVPPNPVGLTHPFHIHGHDFYVLEQGVLDPNQGETLVELSKNQSRVARSRFRNRYFPAKDTVTVPAFGYTIVRILADNPGFWLFHCHFSFHLITGMSVYIQVGELSDIPPTPPGFPRCHNYLPPLDHSTSL